MKNKEQQLLARVVDLFAEKFGKEAILRGGMVLKILGSARYTNDLDYVFVPYKSKNDVVEPILAVLREIPNANIQHSLNSKCLRIVLGVDDISVQIEVKVAKEMKTDAATTKLFSPQFEFPKRVIPVVDHSVSMANKLAAWNERRLVRDLYDLWFFMQMNIKPDRDVLLRRLRKPQYSRVVKKEDYFQGSTIDEFYEFLRAQVALLSQDEVQSQMLDYMLPDETVGLLGFFQAAFVKLGV